MDHRAENRGQGRARVLVIDDEPMVARTILRALVTTCEVDILHTPSVALDLLEAGVEFDVIFCDVNMPGMSGPALYEAVAAKAPAAAARFVFLTGDTTAGATAAFFDRVGNQRLEKPFRLTALRELVETLVARARSLVAA